MANYLIESINYWQLCRAEILKKKPDLNIAIPPGGMRNTAILPDWSCSWSGLIDNEFDGTCVSVVMLKASRK